MAAFPHQASAHATGLSYLDLRLEDSTVRAEFDLPATDLVQALDLDANHDRILNDADVAARDSELTAWLGRSLRILSEGVACVASPGPSQLRDGTLLTVRATYQCANVPKSLYVGVAFEDAIGDGFTTYVRLATTPPHDAVLNRSNPSVAFDLENSMGHGSGLISKIGARVPFLGRILPHLVLGLEHIFTGYDHILFLLSLLLLGGSLRRIVAIATAFTVAHSITLSLSVLNVASLPGAFVESAIAASIAYVAVENYWHAAPLAPGVKEPLGLRWRWALTFAFGLIHGFGFASVLKELGLPKQELPWALGFFNVGVELGQLAIILVTYPLLMRLGQRSWYRPKGVRYASMLVFALAVYWFCLRAFPSET
jgi:hydrogenase/urease accessory protein HupE